MNYANKPLGVKPSPPDQRDYPVSKLVPTPSNFPTKYLISPLPEVYDQKDYDMCVAFSLATIKEIQEWKEHNVRTQYSPGFIYANRSEKDAYGEGMIPREALKQLCKDGVCAYKTFPHLGYLPQLNHKMESAWAACFDNAKTQKINAFARLYTPEDVKSALIQLGPILMCIPVYPSFYRGGDLNMPDLSSEYITGYHAVTVIGWINDRWLIRNSWGPGWGDNGNCTIPFNYPINEMWSITDKTLSVPVENKKYWRVQVGAYTIRSNAEEMALKLKKAGFESYVVPSGNKYLVHAGTFEAKKNAQNLCDMLSKKGFEQCILYY